MTDEVRAAIYDATKLLLRRDYAIAELLSKLSVRHDSIAAAEAVELLAASGFVSDQRAVDSILYALGERKLVGDQEILRRLATIGIEPVAGLELIASRLPSELSRAKDLVARKYKTPAPAPKIGRFLYSRGFDESTIESVLENLSWAESE